MTNDQKQYRLDFAKKILESINRDNRLNYSIKEETISHYWMVFISINDIITAESICELDVRSDRFELSDEHHFASTYFEYTDPNCIKQVVDSINEITEKHLAQAYFTG